MTKFNILRGLMAGVGLTLLPAFNHLSADSPLRDLPATVSASVELVGVVRLPGDDRDKSGLSAKLEDGSFADQLGGFSAIEYTGAGNRFLLLSDRGAGDGAVSYPCRYHEAELVVDPATSSIGFRLVRTQMITGVEGQPLVGSLQAHAADQSLPRGAKNWTALDPEGIRRIPGGELVISDEYGPRLLKIDEQGRVTSAAPVSDTIRLAEVTFTEVPSTDNQTSKPLGDPVMVAQCVSKQGAFPNRGLEGVAVTPDGDTIVAVIQSPLIQDAQIVGDKCLGINCRWFVYDSNLAPAQQVVYRLDSTANGVSEALAIDDHRFLVLERDSKSGAEAKSKRIYLASIQGASDVSNVAELPIEAAPSGITCVSKQLFLDLLDPRFGIGGELAAEKPEGITWGPTLADGRRTLWVCCDNDFDAAKQSEIYCFAIKGI